MDSSAVSARLIGAIFVEKGLITDEQLELALAEQRATGSRLGEILVEQFEVERLDLASALAEQWAEYERQGMAEVREGQPERRATDAAATPAAAAKPQGEPSVPVNKRPIGEIFIERGLVTDDQLEAALTQQKETGVRLGEILVASGKLSRLELASALADQWASFQKLRPPTEVDVPDPVPAGAEQPVLPTPEVVKRDTQEAPASELESLVAGLAARVDEIATAGSSWKPELEETAENLRARLAQLEQALARVPASREDDSAEELRRELALLNERVAAIPPPSDEWRLELAQVAENLRTRIERIEAAGGDARLAELRAHVDEVAARVDTLPQPSEEWRGIVSDLSTRIESLPVDAWRAELAEATQTMHARLEQLEREGVTAGEPPPDQTADLRGQIEELSARLDALPVALDELRHRVEGLPVDAWRPELAEVAENLRTRVERVERQAGGSDETAELRAAFESLAARVDALPAPGADWHDAVGALAARLDALPVASDEWRQVVDELRHRVEGLPVDAWRPELAEVAENLRTRVERVERQAGGSDETAELRAAFESLSARVDALPAPVADWHDAVAAVVARVEGLPVDAWRSELAEVAENLRTRVERVEQGGQGVEELRGLVEDLSGRLDRLPPPSEEWRHPVAELGARVDALAADEAIAETAQAAESLGKRVERIEQGMSGQARAAAVTEIAERLDALAGRIENLPTVGDEWRDEVAALARRIDALPTPTEEWREQIAALGARVEALPTESWKPELAQVADTLRARVEAVERELGGTQAEHARALRAELEQLTARIDATPAWPEELRTELAQRSEAIEARLGQVEHSLTRTIGKDAARETVERLTARIDELSAAIADDTAVAGLTHRIEEVAARAYDDTTVDRLAQRVAEVAAMAADDTALARLGERIDELAGRGDPAELEAVVTPRLEQIETALLDLRTTLAAVPEAVEQRAATVEARVDETAIRAAGDAEGLRRELAELRGTVQAAEAANTARLESVAGTLQAEVTSLAERFASNEAVQALRGAVEQHDQKLESMGGELIAFERRSDEKAAGRTAELGALRARLDTVEAALEHATGWPAAVAETKSQISGLELRLLETSAAEADERNLEIERVRDEFAGRVDALETSQVRPRDLRDLRDIVERVEGKVEDRAAHDAVARQALEDSVRDGLKGIGKKLAASGEAYLETSRELSRSLAGLGVALDAADVAEVAPRVTGRPLDATVFLAFAPTADGYRLVECAGTAPGLDETLTVEGCEGELVVTRIGASPLPFDTRTCVYLDRA